MTDDLNSDRLVSILTNLSELRNWEVEHIPFGDTTTGSYLYYKIAQRAMGQGDLVNRSLKDLHCTQFVSERAIRLKLREFEKSGLVESKVSSQDGRVRYILPSEKFYEVIYNHAQEFDRIFSRNMLLIGRDNG